MWAITRVNAVADAHCGQGIKSSFSKIGGNDTLHPSI